MPRELVGEAVADDPLLGRVVAGFLVVGVLGAGGFGNVHHVIQLPLRARPVQGALKRLRPPSQSGPERRRDHDALRARFESEADALASLSHPNIVRLLKAGIDGDTPYLVLELVTDAVTLEHETDEHHRYGTHFPDSEIVAITEQILSALESAHERGIVHRDIKPGNVMLQRVAGYDVFVRVLDFGLAKFLSDSNDTERVMGTLDYMAPEQMRGRDIGPWTDLYALGLLLLGMVTMRPAFSADRAVLVNEKLDPRYDPVRRALGNLDLDAARVGFMRRATAHDHRERFPSAAAFRRAFQDAFQSAGRSGRRKLASTRDLSLVRGASDPRRDERPHTTASQHLQPHQLATEMMTPPRVDQPAPARARGHQAATTRMPPAEAAPPGGSRAYTPAPAATASIDPQARRWPLLDAADSSIHLRREAAQRQPPPTGEKAPPDTIDAGDKRSE